VPDFAKGQVRDLRVRWALEEAGVPYRTRLLAQGEQEKPEYRALQPFGQVPMFEEDGFVLFETGAIVLHIGERSETLLPKDPLARARATQWLIAALSKRLGDEPYLDGARFTAGDLMMTTVLRILNHTDIVTGDARLAAYIDRCSARPAFRRALDAQVTDIETAA